MDAPTRKVIKIISLFIAAAFLLLLPILIADAANDVASSFQVNNTAVELTATWTEYANISGFATGIGNTTVTITVNTATNSSTARSYGRIKRDGTVIESFNLSQSFYPETVTYIAPMAETEATHNYSFESYCTSGKKCTLYNRTFSATFIKTGSFAASVTNVTALSPLVSTYGATPELSCPNCITNTTAQITRTQVTGQETIDTGQNTSITNIEAVNVAQNATESALQANDTYFNGTVFPNSTNFRNDSALQTSTYSGNFPNSTVASKEATWDAKSVFMNLSVWGQSALASFARFVAGSGITLLQSGTNITISDSGTNSTLTTHTASTGTGVHGLGNISLLNTPLNDSMLENGSVFVKTSNTSYVLTSNGSYVLTNNASYVLTNNGSYVLTSNNSYVKTDNASYVLITNISYVKTDNTSYVLVTNTSYVLTNNGSYVLTSNTSYVLTNNASYVLTSNLTYPRTAVSNSTPILYNSTTGVFSLSLPTCTGTTNRLNSTGSGFVCEADDTSAFSFIVTGGETHTGSITATAGTGITFTDTGGVWTISSPAAGVTNATVDFQNGNASNLTSGQMDFNLRTKNVTINLTSGANVSGLLPDANLASTFVKTVGATSPCTSTGGINPTISCSFPTNATVNPHSFNASNATGVLPNASIPSSSANLTANNTFTGTGNTSFAGNVGIRTTSPTEGVLVVNGGDLAIKHIVGGGTPAVRYYSGAVGGFENARIESTNEEPTFNDAGRLMFYTAKTSQGGLTEKVRIEADGNVGIGNTTPNYHLTIGTGTWSGVNAGDSTFTTSSSRELKDNITEINITTSWQRISNLKPSTFKWNTTKSNMSNNNTVWGLVADEVKLEYPDMDEGKVEWSKILTDLIGAVKFSILKIKQLDNQKLDKVGDNASINRLIVQDVFRIPKYATLPNTYPVGGEAYNTTDESLNVMKPDGWYIVQTTRRE